MAKAELGGNELGGNELEPGEDAPEDELGLGEDAGATEWFPACNLRRCV